MTTNPACPRLPGCGDDNLSDPPSDVEKLRSQLTLARQQLAEAREQYQRVHHLICEAAGIQGHGGNTVDHIGCLAHQLTLAQRREAGLREALSDLAERAHRARCILQERSRSEGCEGNWGILDTSKADAALAASKPAPHPLEAEPSELKTQRHISDCHERINTLEAENAELRQQNAAFMEADSKAVAVCMADNDRLEAENAELRAKLTEQALYITALHAAAKV
jgi:hypothetical protein